MDNGVSPVGLSSPAVDRHVPRIRLTITVAYAMSLLVVLLMTAGALRLAVHAALDREFDNSMGASASLVRQFFRIEVAEYLTIEATLAHIAGELIFEDRAMHMHRPDGSEFEVIGSPKSHGQRLIAPPVRRIVRPLDSDLAPGWTVEVEASAASVVAVKRWLDRWFVLGIPILVVLAALSGWWLTGRTLRPVARMADAASRIEPGSGGRIPINDPTDELGRLGVRFNALLDRVDAALTQQRQFLADAAHELRTPLARARSRVEVAMLPETAKASATSVEPTIPAAPPLEVVHEELVRMSHLVDELLQLARADAGSDGPEAAMHEVFFDDIVTEELRRWHSAAERRNITLLCTTLQEAPITGDPVLLARVVAILVDNALRYGRPDGRVDVRVVQWAERVCLEIEDDGIGILPDEQPRVFERFYRGERARTQRADGSGLGLAIARWIVDQHHGDITLTSGAGGIGTLASVTLPRNTVAG